MRQPEHKPKVQDRLLREIIKQITRMADEIKNLNTSLDNLNATADKAVAALGSQINPADVVAATAKADAINTKITAALPPTPPGP